MINSSKELKTMVVRQTTGVHTLQCKDMKEIVTLACKLRENSEAWINVKLNLWVNWRKSRRIDIENVKNFLERLEKIFCKKSFSKILSQKLWQGKKEIICYTELAWNNRNFFLIWDYPVRARTLTQTQKKSKTHSWGTISVNCPHEGGDNQLIIFEGFTKLIQFFIIKNPKNIIRENTDQS